MRVSSLVVSLVLMLCLGACTDVREVKGGYMLPSSDAGESPTEGMDGSIVDARGADDDAGSDEDGGVEPFGVIAPCAQQLEDALDGLPEDLACTGLYSDIWRKIIAVDVRRFTPALQLYSDGSGKQRWVYLPPGKKIDASEPNDWVFPVGTKFFKEFRINGRRIETRIYQKAREDRWVRATYEWNRDETVARRNFGTDREDILIEGLAYHIPSGRECDQCHGGNADRVLGFQAIPLGLPGAEGVTLADLVLEDLLDPPPVRANLEIGDDGTELAAPALGWLHMNCGITCHNDFDGSEAFSSELRFKLHVSDLDGRNVQDFDSLITTLDVPAKSTRWGDRRRRIIPGAPNRSLVVQLISTREGPKDSMPPIATQLVDWPHVNEVKDWIKAMGEEDE